MSIAQRRMAVYGGAFDPPHLAHMALAQAALAQHGLDELRLLPMGQAWYKTRALSAAEHRIRMLELAFDGLPKALIDPRETRRAGPSYTIETLLELRSEQPGAQLFLLMGQDQLEFFTHWHRHAEIRQIATLLVAFRSDSTRAEGQNSAQTAVKIPHQTITMPSLPISATQIRERVAQGQSIEHLVKPCVARYIAQHQLYSLTSKTP